MPEKIQKEEEFRLEETPRQKPYIVNRCVGRQSLEDRTVN
jgi:hypothetical protein